MKYLKALCILSIIGVFGIFLGTCSPDNPQMSGGTTTETTNGFITGTLAKTDGTPARQTIVKLIESTFDPVKDGPVPDSLIDTTGETGEFAFHVSGGRVYNIEGQQCLSGEGILVSGVTVHNNDTVIVPPGVIRKTGSIKILFPIESDTSERYIYIRGTSIYAIANDSTDFVYLGSVPSGIMPSIYISYFQHSVIPELLADSISVAPGLTTVIAYHEWQYSKKLFLNTTSSGADIAGAVMNFPVLIRLNSEQFDFSEAMPDGSDLRFTKSDGTPVPFEIERWDSKANQAEIWAKIDTVHGNDSTQSITMYWGASTPSTSSGTLGTSGAATISESNGAKVFDTINGFRGVWHLAETDSVMTRDATINGYHGTPSSPAPLAVRGMIGGAQQFNGTSNFIEMNNTENSQLSFAENGSYTVSAWVFVDTLDHQHHAIVDKSDLQYGLEIFGPDNTWDFYQFNSSKSWDGSRSPATAKQWIHLVGVRSGKEQQLFVNGNYVSGIFESTTSTRSRDERGTVMIGKLSYDPETRFFKGIIDEVCLANTARSADWIKLCYMNQNTDDRLVVFGK